ncbi:Dickkopf N-terminal cysteine-rich domain-containing protein [Sorangium cellulosum]|uniref:Dickkopf N-terminal cysteine-rich domain-containing protein n=1 Tax=Sorangium cellulosum TaxID=56 RepID=UPI003D9A18F4
MIDARGLWMNVGVFAVAGLMASAAPSRSAQAEVPVADADSEEPTESIDGLAFAAAGECTSDADCATTEYCHKMGAGPADNVCAPDKQNGQQCSRAAKCLSNCCQWDFFENPFTPTCQPASECN